MIMRNRIVMLCVMLIASLNVRAGDVLKVEVQSGEYWWGAYSSKGIIMPLNENSDHYNLRVDHGGNQATPFIVSNKGRYIWSDDPFEFQFVDGVIHISSAFDSVELVDAGSNLKEAYLSASKSHFPSVGKIPNELFFSMPQYNTWIELMYDQTQEDILKYAHDIIDNGYPAGVLMIDDNWQRQYGNYDFRAEAFSDPKAMVEELHSLGFKVMLWISPMVSADSPEYRDLKAKGFLLKSASSPEPAIFGWWNGQSAIYDLSNEGCYNHVKGELQRLQQEYGIDGFKFDAGDVDIYAKSKYVDCNGENESFIHTELWAKLGTEFDFNEYRACWKLAGEPLVQRLRDKTYAWKALPDLVADMLNVGIMGYAYACPDMIGGGEFTSFLNLKAEDIDQELIVRSCQVHTLMPMMQFSVAPWRVLNDENNAICRDLANLHAEYGAYILELAHRSSTSGEPIVRYMEYEFPGEGFELCKDQFMLGERYLVAPMITKGTERTVVLPKGKWQDENGKRYNGGKSYVINVPIDRLPVFERR